jgi:hypothetical protein
MEESVFHVTGQQTGEPDDVINNCGAPVSTAAAPSSVDDSDDDGGSSGSDTAAQLLLQFAADHNHKRPHELSTADDTAKRHKSHGKGRKLTVTAAVPAVLQVITPCNHGQL